MPRDLVGMTAGCATLGLGIGLCLAILVDTIRYGISDQPVRENLPQMEDRGYVPNTRCYMGFGLTGLVLGTVGGWLYEYETHRQPRSSILNDLRRRRVVTP